MKILKGNTEESAFLSHSINYHSLGKQEGDSDLKFITVHLIIRDNVEKFFFKKNADSKKLDYKTIDHNSIIITDYPVETTNGEKPSLKFEFSTSEGEISEYKYFDMYIHFVTEKKNKKQGDHALTISGHREGAPVTDEDDTDQGIIYFPDLDVD